jgi:hypothetical protein
MINVFAYTKLQNYFLQILNSKTDFLCRYFLAESRYGLSPYNLLDG